MNFLFTSAFAATPLDSCAYEVDGSLEDLPSIPIHPDEGYEDPMSLNHKHPISMGEVLANFGEAGLEDHDNEDDWFHEIVAYKGMDYRIDVLASAKEKEGLTYSDSSVCLNLYYSENRWFSRSDDALLNTICVKTLEPDEREYVEFDDALDVMDMEIGTHYLFLDITYPEKHEDWGDHNISSRSDKTEYVKIEIKPAEEFIVNLTAQDFQFLETPKFAGDEARFGVNVVNIGNTTPISGIEIRGAYYVQCPGMNGAQYLTDDGTDPEALFPGNYVWEETLKSVTMPNTPGNCTAYFCTDYENSAPETDETDNCASFPFTLQAKYSNLKPTSISFKGNTTLKAGSDLYGAKFTVINNGNSDSNGFKSIYEIKRDDTDKWIEIATDGTDPLKPGSSSDEEINSLIQAPTTPGNYKLRVRVDYLGNETESSEDDNISSELSFTVIEAKADFVITEVYVEQGSTVKKNKKFNLRLTVKNQGDGNAQVGIRSAYYYNGPETGYSWVYITDDGTDAGELKAGQSQGERHNGGFKIGKKGYYTFRACADYQGVHSESNEGNNCRDSGLVRVK